VSGAFQSAGVPQAGIFANPCNLLQHSADLFGFDAYLAARQIAWIADTIKRLDRVSAAGLRSGDPTPGKPSILGLFGASSQTAKEGPCHPTEPQR